ncbi:MAG TPA: hypothetical protein VEC99_16560 [Clostridia bacterium]|nr:hypothetical protein [Clostridia bacterium]
MSEQKARKRKRAVKNRRSKTIPQLPKKWRQLWKELHPGPPPPINHPIPKLTVPPIPARDAYAGKPSVLTQLLRRAQGSKRLSSPLLHVLLTTGLLLFGTGCHVLTYQGPHGERFSRSVLGVNTSISSLVVEADTNGIRRVQIQGYRNNATQALGTVTEAAVRAAIQSTK